MTTDIDCLHVIPGSLVPHTHEPDTTFTEGLKVRADMKKNASVNRGKPSQIVKDMLKKCPKEVGAAAGQVEALKQVVRRVKKGSVPKNPSYKEDIPIPLPEDYAKEVIYDNERPDRLIIFATEAGISLIGDAEELFMDGTYSMKPPQFAQLYVIRAPLGETSVPVAYAFLPSKEQTIYEEMLEALLDACTAQGKTAAPKRVIIDFEKSMINAVQAVLDTSVQCCFFHLSQNTYRHINSEGLSTAYMKDRDVRTFCGKVDGLAFLPVQDVKAGMDILLREAPDQLRFLVEYFDSYYVNGKLKAVRNKVTNNISFRRTPPLFPPSLWNVHEATINDKDRTNNKCESGNNTFKHLVGTENPSLWTVIQCIETENHMVKVDLQRTTLPKKRVRKHIREHQLKLKDLCNQYKSQEVTLPEFLNAIGKCIRLKKQKKK